MDKVLKEKLTQDLQEQKSNLKKELESFAKEDTTIKGNWDAKRVNVQDADMTDMEEKADKMEEYDNLLSLEHSLELRLKDVNTALEKIGQGKYGICEKCGKEIEEERLLAYPEARLCVKCNENK